MKYLLASITLAAALVAGAPVSAAESPEMELKFLVGLREHGYPELALEYIARLKANPKLDPALAAGLPLEGALDRMAAAEHSPLDQRAGMYDQAESDLKAFVTQNPTRPETVRARIEIARIAALKGKAKFSRALRQQAISARIKDAKEARGIFAGATKDLKDALPVLDAQIQKYKGASSDEDKQRLAALRKERLLVEFDLGISLLLQAETYILSPDSDADLHRGELARQAYDKLNEVRQADANDPLCNKAAVWLIPCALTADEPKKALSLSSLVDRVKLNAANRDAKLLADYFHMALVLREPKPKQKPLPQIIKEGRAWLKSRQLDRFGQTPDGYGVWVQTNRTFFVFVPSTAADVQRAVKYQVAEALYAEAEPLAKKNPKSPQVAALYDEALKLLAPLEKTESDLTPKAKALHLAIFIDRRGGKIDLNSLRSFDDFVRLAQYERGQYFSAKTKEQQAGHLKTMAHALTRALEVADAATPSQQVQQAGYELVDVYLNLGDYYRAAVLGEHLARSNPPTKDNSLAAAYALEAYSRILAQDERLVREADNNSALTDQVARDALRGDQERFRRLALFVDQQPVWQNEPVVQLARYQRATMALRDGHVEEAIGLLETTQPSWEGYPMARYQLVFALLRLAKKDATREQPATVLGIDIHYPAPVPPEQKAAYQKRAWDVLQGLPAPTAQTGPTAFRLYFAAKLEQCRLLYAGKKYAELEAQANQLEQEFDRLAPGQKDLEQGIKDDLRLGMETWKNYALVGRVEQAYDTGKYDAVLSMVQPTIARVEKQVQAKEKIKDFPLVRDMLELALRAHVQKKDPAGARRILALLQRIAADPDLTEGGVSVKPTEILVRLVLQLKGQINELQRKGPSAKAELDRTVANFSVFLDELTKDLDKLTEQLDAMSKQGNKKSLKRQILSVLAGSYASMGKHKQAAQLFKLVPEPKGEKGKPPSPAEVQEYKLVRLRYARELRLDKQFKEAADVLNSLAPAQGAKLNLTEIIQGLEVEMEQAMLLEDQGKYVEAISKWAALTRNGSRMRSLLADRNFEGLLNHVKDEERGRMSTVLAKMYQDLLKMYWDCYYHKTYSIYMFAKNTKNPGYKAKYLDIAVANILALERAKNQEGWELTRQQFQDLLQNEKLLRDRYNQKKAG